MKKLVIITSGSYPSQGVLNLIKYISYSLIRNKNFKKKYNIKIFIFREDIILKVKKIIYNFLFEIRNFFFKEKKRIHKFSNSAETFFEENHQMKDHIIFFSKKNDYKNYLPDLVLPVQDRIIKKNYKSLGYIYDLQHIDLPNYFKRNDKRLRNNNFKYLIKNSDGIIVNSLFVKNGILKNYKTKKKDIHVIPFLPYSFDNQYKENKDVKKKYNIKNDYFIICNHFWKHKNHQLAFEAFKILQKKFNNLELVCTGFTHDSRFPVYFKNLKKKYNILIKNDKIKILSHIPRSDQLTLIKKSLSVIQPSLYEGGPGGFSAYEAISLGKNLILSDIKINKEIKHKNILFFKRDSAIDLCKKMFSVVNKKKKLKRFNNISSINQKKLGNYFLKLFHKILND
jgi:glycosyltransferase involved in cell wall biosynthesis